MRWLRSLLLISVLGAVLAACGPSATAYASKACGLVRRSLALYHAAADASPSTGLIERREAERLLEQAVQPANLAASTSTAWQALAGTLAEVGLVPEDRLAPTLSAQCTRTALEGGEYVVPFKSQGG
jgi:hypothetical protein